MTLIETPLIVSAVLSVVLWLCGRCFTHFHDKLKNPEGRKEVIRHLHTSNLTDRYVDLLRSVLKAVIQFSGKPFSLRSLGVSVTLAAAYQYVAAAIGRFYGSPSRLGDLNLFQIGQYKSIRFDSEIGQVFVIFMVTILAIIGPRAWRLMRSDVNRCKSSSTSNGLKPYESLTACLVGVAAGGLIGAVSGFFPIVLPTMLASILLFSMTRWEASVSMVIVINALISTISGAEANVVENLFPIHKGGVIAWTISIVIVFSHSHRIDRRNILCLMGPMSICMALVYLIYRLVSVGSLAESMVVILIFWIALPIANGINDYISLGVTQTLLQRIVRSCKQTLSSAVFWGILDLLLAIALILVVAVCVVFALALSEWCSPIAFGLRTFVINSASDPLGYGVWVAIMVLTTLVWTGFHFLIILAALIVRLHDGNPLDRHAVESLSSGGDALWVKLYLSTKWLITVVLWITIVGLGGLAFVKVSSYLGVLELVEQLALLIIPILAS